MGIAANTIIKAALRRLVVVPSGGTPTTNQYTDGLEVLNDLLKSWSADLSLVYEDTEETLTIPSATQSFTMGATGDQVTTRPLEIRVASIIDGNIEYPMRIVDEKTYQSFSNKSSIGIPLRLYYRNTYPNGTVYFEYTTNTQYTLRLQSIKQLTRFADGTTEIDLPEHYERALKANLAIEWADELGAGKRVTPALIKAAEESKKIIIGLATDIVPSRTDIPSQGRYNINSDSY